MMKDLPVLIVGAGPAGLVLAIELARRHVPFRIIDALPAPILASKAKGLQPRTLEIFECLGVIDKILAGGGKFPRWRSYDGEQLRWEKSIYELLGREERAPTIDRPYTETWMIPQWRTEQILRTRLIELGGNVEFGTAFVTLKQNSDGVVVSLRAEDRDEQVRCRYLVGSDGAGSEVRKALSIPFTGQTRANERYILADVQAPALEKNFWHNWSMDGDAVRRISMCPMPDSDYFQFVAPLEPDSPLPNLSLSALQHFFDERARRGNVTLADARWLAFHRANMRLADRFRSGAVFLVGDAAHSPPTSPGQGLNLSIQDAYNLGWKLAAVVAGAPDSLLDSFEEERRRIAAGVLGVLAAELVAQSVDAAAAEALQQEIKRDIFNLDHNYRGSSLSRDTRAMPGVVQAGDRAPDAIIRTSGGRQRRIFDMFHEPSTNILAFNCENALAEASFAKSGFNVKSFQIQLDAEHGPSRGAHEIYGVKTDTPTFFLVRPDGYVGLVAEWDVGSEVTNWPACPAPPRT